MANTVGRLVREEGGEYDVEYVDGHIDAGLSRSQLRVAQTGSVWTAGATLYK